MYGLTRDKEFINSVVSFKDGKFYCSKRCAIEFPTWYTEKGLANFGGDLSYLGIAVIIVENKYAVMTIPTIVRSNPIMLGQIDRDGTMFTRMEFGPNNAIISNDEVVKETLLSYDFFNNYFLRSKVPWFIEYEDLSKCMNLLVQYAGSNAGASPIANELTVSFLTRDDKDPNVFYRQTDLKGKYVFVDLMNVFFSVRNVIDRISGGYFDNAIVGSLLAKPQEPTSIEKHLKG